MAKKNENVYFGEISKIPLLSLEEEKALAAKAFSGDKNAQNKLIESNLRFVVKIANQYKGYMELEDLINEGNMGLMHAAKKFNPEKGAKFSTYAVWWIKAYIQKAIRETSTGVRFPGSKYEEMKLDKWHFASLDKAVSGKEGEMTTFGSLLQDDFYQNPEDSTIMDEDMDQLFQLMSTLKETEKTVLIKRYGLDGNKPMSLSAIGDEMGYCKERIRQIECKAIGLLRKGFENDSFDVYEPWAA